MTNEIFSNKSLKITVPVIPKINLNETAVFGGTFADKNNNIIFQLKQANAEDWPASYLLAKGEPGFELDTGKLKIGDGYTIWSELNYINSNPILNPNDVLEYYENTILLQGQQEAEIGQTPSKATDGAITWITPVSQDYVDNLASRLTTLENGAILGLATEEEAGAVKGSNDVNKITVDNDGTMSINSIGVEKLVNNGYTLILNNGQAT